MTISPAGDAVREKAGGDGELIAAERRRQRPPDEAVGAVRADDHRGAARTSRRVDLESAGASPDLRHARGQDHRSGATRRVDDGAVEFSPAGDHQRLIVE